MKLAFQDKLCQLTEYAEVFGAAKKMGFDGVEITHFNQPLNDSVATEIRQAVDRTGIPVSAVCGGYAHWIGDFDEVNRLEAVGGISASMRYIAELGGSGLIAPAAYGMFSRNLPPFQPPRDSPGDRIALIDSLQRIAEVAEKYGVMLYLEPLNRYEDHMINTVSQAVSLIAEVESEHIKVLGDFFHMNMEESNIVDTIGTYMPHMGYFHLADNHRKQPGEGHTDFHTAFSELRRAHYQGFLSLECHIHAEGSDALRNILHYLRAI